MRSCPVHHGNAIGSPFSSRLLGAANAVASGDFHAGTVKNLLREAAAKLVGYEAFQEAGTRHSENGDPIWEYYDSKLWRDLLFWKERFLELERWANSMPDAGFTSEDPRWKWWNERPRLQSIGDLFVSGGDDE